MPMLIDCDTCAGRNVACDDCVINVLLSRPPQPVQLDASEQHAFATLADAGLVPPLRLVPVVRIAPDSSANAGPVAEAG
jgi:hypothetical protein